MNVTIAQLCIKHERLQRKGDRLFFERMFPPRDQLEKFAEKQGAVLDAIIHKRSADHADRIAKIRLEQRYAIEGVTMSPALCELIVRDLRVFYGAPFLSQGKR